MITLIERRFAEIMSTGSPMWEKFRVYRIAKVNVNVFWGFYKEMCSLMQIAPESISTFKYRWSLVDVFIPDIDEGISALETLFTGEYEEYDDEVDNDDEDSI